MKIVYAIRRGTFYPFDAGNSWLLPDGEARAPYLRKVRDIGFEGIDLDFDSFGGFDVTEGQVHDLRKVLDDAGTPCVVVRKQGSLCHPGVAAQNLRKLRKSVEIVGWNWG